MNLDFSFVNARKKRSNFDAVCPHDPDCEVHESSVGPIYICQMGDFHLLNAYAKLLRAAEDVYGGPAPSGDGAIMARERMEHDYENIVDAMRTEIEKRGLKPK